ncbi:small integral membrane protein 34 [Phodopus roborovskii]|uniref:small integral membrane protein 34 n=1 Tax=Phodopus roborovskii TaxID=109678 RepID=UPI0021E4F1D2|nr:small integral membrane protein 34 [Phodopus roborovskii]
MGNQRPARQPVPSCHPRYEDLVYHGSLKAHPPGTTGHYSTLPWLGDVAIRGLETWLLRAVIKWKPQEAFNQTQSSPLLRDPVEGRNCTNSTRNLRLLDTTGAAWYILAIIGIYGVIFIFQMASNILRRDERSLDDIYYSNLTSELERKGGFQSKVAECSLIIRNPAAHQPQDGLEPKGE